MIKRLLSRSGVGLASKPSSLPPVANGGDARFAEGDEIAALCRARPDDGAWVFGEAFRQDAWLLSDRTVRIKDPRHVMVVCPSRGGKGECELVQNILEWPASVVSIDPKGEAALITARIKALRGHDVKLLDPFGVCAMLNGAPLGFESSFDPLSAIDPSSPSAAGQLRALVEAMVIDDSKSEKYWSLKTKEFVRGLLARFLLWPGKSRPTIGALFDILGLSEAGMEDYVKTLLSGLPPDHDLTAAVVEGIKAYLESEQKSRGTLKQMVRNALSVLSESPIRKVMEPGDWTFADVQRRPIAIYLVLPPDMLVSHATWLRTMVFCAKSGMTRVPPPKTQTLVVLDEFYSLGGLDVGISYVAGLGMKLVIVIQDISQLTEHYPQTWQTFIANCGAIAVLAAGDTDTQDQVSRLLGQAKMITRAKSLTDLDEDGRTTETVVPLMTPSQIGLFCSRDTRGMLLIIKGKRPMRLRARPYHEVLRAGIDYDIHPEFRPENYRPMPTVRPTPMPTAPTPKGTVNVRRRPRLSEIRAAAAR